MRIVVGQGDSVNVEAPGNDLKERQQLPPQSSRM
jgi:hypothetical protein